VHTQHRLVLAQQQGLVPRRQVNELSVAIHSSLSAASADLSGRAAGSSKTKASSTTREKLGSEHTITLGAFRLDAVTTKKTATADQGLVSSGCVIGLQRSGQAFALQNAKRGA